MALTSVKEKTNLKLVLDGGMVGDNQKLISKSFTKVKVEAQDQELYEVAKALESLQNKAILDIRKIEETSLKDE